MTEAVTQKRKQFKSISPSFLVDDVVRSAEYYRDVLGFSFEHYWGEPPRFVILGRESTEISLCSPGRRGLARPNRKADADAPWDAYVFVAEADELCDEFTLKGARIVRGPETTSYEMREFEVEDINGYILCFGQDVSLAKEEENGVL